MHALVAVEELRRLNDADRRIVEVWDELEEELPSRNKICVEYGDEVAVALFEAKPEIAGLLQVPRVRPAQVDEPVAGSSILYLRPSRIVEDVNGDLPRPPKRGYATEGVVENRHRLAGRRKEDVDGRDPVGQPSFDLCSMVRELKAPTAERRPHRRGHRDGGEAERNKEQPEHESRSREQRHADADQRI